MRTPKLARAARAPSARARPRPGSLRQPQRVGLEDRVGGLEAAAATAAVHANANANASNANAGRRRRLRCCHFFVLMTMVDMPSNCTLCSGWHSCMLEMLSCRCCRRCMELRLFRTAPSSSGTWATTERTRCPYRRQPVALSNTHHRTRSLHGGTADSLVETDDTAVGPLVVVVVAAAAVAATFVIVVVAVVIISLLALPPSSTTATTTLLPSALRVPRRLDARLHLLMRQPGFSRVVLRGRESAAAGRVRRPDDDALLASTTTTTTTTAKSPSKRLVNARRWVDRLEDGRDR